MTAVSPERSPQEASGRRQRLRDLVLSGRLTWVTLGTVIVAELVVFAIAAPRFLSTTNLLNAGRATAVLMVVATGATFGLISGALDISVGSVMALSGTIGTQIVIAGYPASLAILAAIGSGIGVGLINGIVVVKLRVNPLVATLGMLGIALGVAFVVDGGAGIAGNLRQTTDAAYGVMKNDLVGIPLPLVFAVLFAAAGWVLLARTRFGLYAYAVGGNASAGRSVALPVDRLRMMYLAFSGACAATGGYVLSSMLGGSGAASVPGTLVLTVVTAVFLGGVGLLGGTGTMGGTILGVIVLGVLENGMTLAGWPTFYQYVVEGLLLLAAVGLDALRSGGYR
jgi:ribose/xylose/arabinose/galactoside ABC-type transport system permease subunit